MRSVRHNNVTDISIDRVEMKLEAAEEAKLFDGKNIKPAYTEAVYGLNAGGLVGVTSPGADASITGRLYLGRLTDVSSAGGAAGGVIGSVTGTNRAGVYGYVLAKAEAGEKGVTGFDKNTEGKWVFAPSDTAYASPYLTGIVGILDQPPLILPWPCSLLRGTSMEMQAPLIITTVCISRVMCLTLRTGLCSS